VGSIALPWTSAELECSSDTSIKHTAFAMLIFSNRRCGFRALAPPVTLDDRRPEGLLAQLGDPQPYLASVASENSVHLNSRSAANQNMTAE
jgi:hypothetical protein